MFRTLLIFASLLAPPGIAEEYREFAGHGGPVMGVSVSPDASHLLTASFDNSVGLWDLRDDIPAVWLEGHDAAVNCVTFLTGHRAASGSDDFAVIVWDLDARTALHRLEGHQGKVMSVAGNPEGTRLASASWDGSIRIWNLENGTSAGVLLGHRSGVNAVEWSADGQRLYSASSDGTIEVWDTATGRAMQRLASHGFGVNALAVNEPSGWLAYGAADGGIRAVDLDTGDELADLTADRRPILGFALSPDGSRLAAGDGHGYITVIDTGTWRIERDFRAALNGPIWALAFTRSGTAVIAGGMADEAYRWPLDGADSRPLMAETRRQFHTDPSRVPNGERQFLRKCSVCHTLGSDGDRRAGPSLSGLFGRVAGSVPSYNYSDALRDSGIVWSRTTIDRLFDLGPLHYIPGTKMPMQRITSQKDRTDLIDFLRRETRTE